MGMRSFLVLSDDVAACLASDGVVGVLLSTDSAEHSCHLNRESEWQVKYGFRSVDPILDYVTGPGCRSHSLPSSGTSEGLSINYSNNKPK